jgi:hypothetical protein
MDFFEKLFGVDPDGGNGSLEMLMLIGLVAIVLLVGFAAMHRYRSESNRY